MDVRIGLACNLRAPKAHAIHNADSRVLETFSPAKWSMLRFSLLMLEAASADLISPSASDYPIFEGKAGSGSDLAKRLLMAQSGHCELHLPTSGPLF